MALLHVLDDVVARLEALVGELEPGLVDAAGAARLVECFARAERLCAAGKALAARRVEECGTWRSEGYRSGAHWLAARSGSTVGDAEGVLHVARALPALDATAIAFRAGHLSAAQAREVVDAASVDATSEAALIETAASASMKVLRDECRRVRATSVVDDAAWAAKQQIGRRLDRWTDPEGFTRGDWKLPSHQGALVNRALDDEIEQVWRAARRDGRRDPRAAYAADALVNLVTRGPRKPPELKLTADLTAIERGYVTPGERCEIDGFGPIPVTVARAVMQDARVSVLVAEPDGDIRHVTSPKPTISRALRRRLEHRDRVCANHACRADGPFEIDHIVPRADHGPTSLDNCWRLCRHCHRLKTYFGWRVAVDDEGHRTLAPP
jgi:hypothetical protein